MAATIKKVILRKAVIDPYSMDGKKLPHLTGKIEFQNVHFSYPSRIDTPVNLVYIQIVKRTTYFV